MTAPPPSPIFYSYFLSYLFSHLLVTLFLACPCVCDCRCDSLWGLVSVERFPKVAQTRLSRVNCVRQCFLLPSADDGYCRGVTHVRWSSGWGCRRGVVMGPVSAGVEKSQYPILPPPHGQPVRSCLQAADVSPPPIWTAAGELSTAGHVWNQEAFPSSFIQWSHQERVRGRN